MNYGNAENYSVVKRYYLHKISLILKLSQTTTVVLLKHDTLYEHYTKYKIGLSHFAQSFKLNELLFVWWYTFLNGVILSKKQSLARRQ